MSTGKKKKKLPTFPAQRISVNEKIADLRYGENPHQRAALYRNAAPGREPEMAAARILQGKELSYNNLLDLTLRWLA